MWFTLVALLVALACAAAMMKRVRRLQKLELPSVAALVERAQQSSASDDVARIQLEIDDLVRDIDGETHALPELTSALTRVALASGTALALLSLATNFGFQSLPYAGACFGTGVVGAMLVSYLGRLASVRSRAIRTHWREVSAKARRQIGGVALSENARNRG